MSAVPAKALRSIPLLAAGVPAAVRLGDTPAPADARLADVIRTADLPQDVALVLSGHIHRHQVLRPAGRPPVIYAGSVERTSFAETPETKGFVVFQLTRSGLGPFEFRPLPARPMATRTLSFEDIPGSEVRARLAAGIESTPEDAVVQLRVTGAVPSMLTAAMLRTVAGTRTVTLAIRTPDRRKDEESEIAMNNPGSFGGRMTSTAASEAARPVF